MKNNENELKISEGSDKKLWHPNSCLYIGMYELAQQP
jgi:hypothetical protein